MTVEYEFRDRDLVPRWRGVAQSVAAGEFQRLRDSRHMQAEGRAAAERAIDRFDNTGAPWDGGEALSSALVLGDAAQIVRVAEGVLGIDGVVPHPLKQAAMSLLRREAQSALSPEVLSHEDVHNHIRLLKSARRRDPRSALVWSELARRYASIGQFSHAESNLKVALRLAPTSRYITRSAARFYLLADQIDRAHFLVRSHERGRTDPWLVATRLALESQMGRVTQHVKAAWRLAEDENFRPIERSELRSQLATFEMRAGSDKRARRAFRESLVDPNDNSLAQATWAAERLPALIVPEYQGVPYTSEARSLRAHELGQWERSYAAAKEWMADQPFDSRAAVMATYVATVGLQRWDEAANLASLGLRANPDDMILRNNLAYCLIEMGETRKASEVLSRLPDIQEQDRLRLPIMATRGLLAYRTGNSGLGSMLYDEAITGAERMKDRDMAIRARIMKVRETSKLMAQDEREGVERWLDSLRIRTPAVEAAANLLRQSLAV